MVSIFRADLFFWPWVLWALIFLPLLIWFYRRALKGKALESLSYPDLKTFRFAGKRFYWARYGQVLFFLALLFSLLALARPSMAIPEAHPQAGVVLAIDVSRSMYAQDIEPNRFEAAKAAIQAFIDNVPDNMRVGLVSFASYATQIVPLTDDHALLRDAVEYLTTDYGTVIGDGLLRSLQALPSLETRQMLGDNPQRFATIILLSDGRNFGGLDPLLALESVKEAKVTVHTIGVGSQTDGPIPGIPLQFQFAARFDEETMRQIAEETGGSFNFVDSSAELERVYKDLSRAVVWRYGRSEATAVTALLAAFCLFMSLLSANLSRRVY